MKSELGITVSVGVSFNKIFAKLGSDYKKPDAITTMYKSVGPFFVVRSGTTHQNISEVLLWQEEKNTEISR